LALIKKQINIGANALQIFAIVLLSIVGASAFALSFKALREKFESVGNDDSTSFLFPIIIDGPILAATVAIFYLSDTTKSKSAKAYAWFVLILFSVASVVFNISHAIDQTSDIITASLMAATPPIALMLTIHLLALLIHKAKVTKRTAVAKVAVPVTSEKEVKPAIANKPALAVKSTVKEAPVLVESERGDVDDVVVAKPKSRKKENSVDDKYLLQKVAEMVSNGGEPTSKDVQAWLEAPNIQSGSYHLRRLKKEYPEAFSI